MTRSPTRTRVLCLGAALLCAIPGLFACQDAAGDPLAVVLTEETRSTLLVEGETASLPELVAMAGLEGALSDAVHGWVVSWDEPEERASSLREEAYVAVAGPLVRELGTAAIVGPDARLAAALRAARAVPGEDLTPEMARRIDEAARLHEEARAHVDAGHLEEGLVRTLRASDALRAVGPEGVARALTARATRALETLPAASPTDGERATRLVRGARTALEHGAWTRAIRRAFYACQILGVATR